MRYLQYNLFERDTKNASGKAKNDVSAILRKYGFQNLYNPSANAYIRLAQQFFSILCIPKESFMFVQYPANLNVFYKILSLKKCFKVAIIHDLESLRGFIDVQQEITILNMFNVVISHNSKMTEYLKENGLKTKVFELQIFDYLIMDNNLVNSNYKKDEIAFAGNLQKSEFLCKLDRLSGLNFKIYGVPKEIGDSLHHLNNIDYKGAFPAEKLIEVIQGGWGLVWDGDTVDTCNGVNGEYMKYNCPHKVSMYIIAERPVIIWEKSAMAEFVKENNLGVVINSLVDLPALINGIRNEEYLEYLDSVRKLKKILVEGKSLGNIIEKLITNKK